MDLYYKRNYPDIEEPDPTAFNSMVFPISAINNKLKRYLNDPVIVGDSKFSQNNF